MAHRRGTCTRLDLFPNILVALGRRPHTVAFALDFVAAVQKEFGRNACMSFIGVANICIAGVLAS